MTTIARSLAIVAVLLCLGTATSFAATLNLTPQSFGEDELYYSWDLSTYFTKWTPAHTSTLGTLTSVTFAIEATLTAGGTVTGDPVTGGTAAPVFGYASFSMYNPFTFDVVNFSQPVATWGVTVAPGETKTLDEQSVTENAIATYNTAGNLIACTGTLCAANVSLSILPSYFMGTGNIDLEADGDFYQGATWSSGSGNTDLYGKGKGIASVSYTYTEDNNVPEPLTYAMCGAGLLAISVLRRRMAR